MSEKRRGGPVNATWGPPPTARQVRVACVRFCASVAPYLFHSEKVGDVRSYDFMVDDDGKVLVWFGEGWIPPDSIAGRWAAVALPERTDSEECSTCARKPGEKNHPRGMIFVGWGNGWQPCPNCGGSGNDR